MKKIVAILILIIVNISLALAINEPKANKKTILVKFSEIPSDYKSLIEATSGEIVNEYKNLKTLAIRINENDVSKLLKLKNLVKIQENKKVKALLHNSAPLIFANDVWEKGFTGKDVKICILDTGIKYNHPFLDPYCNIKEVINGTVIPYVLQSPHPYPIVYNYTWIITLPEFEKISVHFVNISLEDGYDFIYIKDALGNTLQTFTGLHKDVWSVPVSGNTIKINLVSDNYGCLYGFYIDKVTNGTINMEFDNCSKIIGGYDFINNDNDPFDDNGHGTHVAGIISSNDEYSRGVANNSKLLIAKVLDSAGSGTYSSVLAGIDWCVNNSAQIISMSLGGDSYLENCDDDILADAVNNAVEKGITVVAAAGNSGSCGINTPACASKAIAVGSIDKNKSVTGFSSKGIELDILAPGKNINSTYLYDNWLSMSGTSMSTPFVTGIIALMLEANPFLTPPFIKDVIKQTAEPVENCYNSYEIINGICTKTTEAKIPCNENVTGSGIINALRAVELVSIDFSAPKYSNINKPSDSVYSPYNTYNFSIMWIDDKVIDTVTFELNEINYTNLTKNGNIYSISFNLPVGIYKYKWYANDTSGKTNSTELFNLKINKAIPNLTLLLNGFDKNITVLKNTTINITSYLDFKGVIEIYENDNLLEMDNSPLTKLVVYDIGSYKITSYFRGNENYTEASKTYFIDIKEDLIPPIITILTPQNTTYYSNSISLKFIINEPTIWCGYSLDGKNITSIECYNTTLNNLSYGNHNITFYAKDMFDNFGNSSTVYFTIKKSGGGGCGKDCLLR